jgi:hypothetical protein
MKSLHFIFMKYFILPLIVVVFAVTTISVSAHFNPFLYSVAAQETTEAPLPSVRILSPQEGQVYEEGAEVTFEYAVENFLFVDYKNNAEPFPGNPNAGHAYLWVDAKEFKPETGRKLLSVDPVPLGTLAKGRHELTVELVQNHKVPFDPPVRATVVFFVGKKSAAFVGGGKMLTSIGAAAIALLAVGALWLLWQRGMLEKLAVLSRLWEQAKRPRLRKPPMSSRDRA